MRQHNVLNPVMSNLDSRLPLRWIPHQFNDLVLGTTLVCQVLGGFVTEQSKGFFVHSIATPKNPMSPAIHSSYSRRRTQTKPLGGLFFCFFGYFFTGGDEPPAKWFWFSGMLFWGILNSQPPTLYYTIRSGNQMLKVPKQTYTISYVCMCIYIYIYIYGIYIHIYIHIYYIGIYI